MNFLHLFKHKDFQNISGYDDLKDMLEGFVNMKGDDKDYTQDNNDIFYYQAKKVFIKSKERDITVTLDG